MEGSSSMSSLGRDMSARPMASICCSPPERVAGGLLAAFAQDGEHLVGALDVLFDALLVGAQEGAELEVFGDRQPGEDVASLGGVGEAQGDDLVGGDLREGLAVEGDGSAERA